VGRSEAPDGPLAAVHELRFQDAVAAMHSLHVAMQSVIRDGRRAPVIACGIAAALLLLALAAAVAVARRSR
jgi:hypothetical protein